MKHNICLFVFVLLITNCARNDGGVTEIPVFPVASTDTNEVKSEVPENKSDVTEASGSAQTICPNNVDRSACVMPADWDGTIIEISADEVTQDIADAE